MITLRASSRGTAAIIEGHELVGVISPTELRQLLAPEFRALAEGVLSEIDPIGTCERASERCCKVARECRVDEIRGKE